MMSHVPVSPLNAEHAESVFVWQDGCPISKQVFMQQVQAVAKELPQSEYAINLCEDRYLFLVVFVAMLMRGQVNLLPANRSVAEVQSVSKRYGGCPCVVDRPRPELGVAQHLTGRGWPTAQRAEVALPQFDDEQVCAVVFTSGSSGESQPWVKRWGELQQGASMTSRALELGDAPLTVVATVPPQHMYGLEMTILLPLVSGLQLDSGRPFFPQDLQQALASVPEPRLLVTTPVHLHACLRAGLDWPALKGIVCATAPLSRELAEQAERSFDCPLHEIYGSTETGAIAVRRTRHELQWTLYPELRIVQGSSEACVSVDGGHLPRAVTLNDRIQVTGTGRFELLGRNSDMLKIAGKRVSLGDLNHKLLAIPGVEDGVFIDSADEGEMVRRLCAVVVAPSLSSGQILDALKEQLDPVCLPRPLYRVDRLPRNEAGKLPRKELLRLLQQLRGK